MKRIAVRLVTLVAVATLFACGKDKEMADAAIKAADQALSTVRAEATKFVPEQLQAVETALTTTKENFTKGDYKNALTGAQDVATKAQDLAKAALAKKEELTKTWTELAGNLPNMVTSIKTQIATFTAMKKLPATMTKEKLEAAQNSLNGVTQLWTQASEAFSGGNMTDAIAKAKTVKDKATEIMNTLGMSGMTAQK